MKKIIFLLLILISACSPKFQDRNVFKINVVYINGKHNSHIVQFYHDPQDLKLILENNCIKYGKDKRDLLCNVKKFKSKKLK